MLEKEKGLARAVELPICPFCDGKIYYTSWTTHKIFQMECNKCGAHWRTVITKGDQKMMSVELTSSRNPEISYEYINKKLSMQYWKNMLRQRIEKNFKNF
jgi:hypothetical protein